MEFLDLIYNDKRILSIVSQHGYETRMNRRDASEYLIKNNYDRKYIEQIINKEQDVKTFYYNRNDILRDFPDVIWDYKLIY